MKEIWKPVSDNPEYHVSNLGRVKSFKYDKVDGKIMSINTCGRYSSVNLTYKNMMKTFYIHRLVAGAFMPNPEVKPQVHHIDGNPYNNRVDNLMWVTQKENNNFAKYRGNHARNRKLTDKDVRMIRWHYSNGNYSQKELAEFYDCTKSNISRITRRVSWNHI